MPKISEQICRPQVALVATAQRRQDTCVRMQALLPVALERARLKDRVLGHVSVFRIEPVGVDLGSARGETVATDCV